ncbi:phosphopantetheine-binding protein [Myceligenerans xiligouense]|uniref:Phosphopantetheine binding protein n=1 Tax=Myceligenerans xiligouense TaxID=253184 RepID=A0A3N4Z472_9MICO|nr:phosphopantetheine-binding protein [Myceligenerans xiligouense]RPF19992.1 phosphopantetheine binding protein [Myceligenerans xiligouense]
MKAEKDERVDPGTMSAAIGETMGEVLGVAALGADEDFFARGGDSLRALEMVSRLGSHPAVPLARSSEAQSRLVESVFVDGTPAGLATVLTEFENH